VLTSAQRPLRFPKERGLTLRRGLSASLRKGGNLCAEASPLP